MRQSNNCQARSQERTLGEEKKKKKIIKKTGVFSSPQTAIGEAVSGVQRTGKHKTARSEGKEKGWKTGSTVPCLYQS